MKIIRKNLKINTKLSCGINEPYTLK